MVLDGIGIHGTVDVLYTKSRIFADRPLGTWYLLRILSKYGVTSTVTAMQEASIIAEIDAGRPVIALVHYGTYSTRGLTESSYTKGHWFLVVGYGVAGFIVHDPLWMPGNTGGEFMRVPFDLFQQSRIENKLDNNSTYRVLKVNQKFEYGDLPGGGSIVVPPDAVDRLWRHHVEQGDDL
jgi:hypothetical protein